MRKRNLNILLILFLLMIWAAVMKKFFWNPGEINSQISNLENPYDFQYVGKKDSIIFKVENESPFAVSKLKETRKAITRSQPDSRPSQPTPLKKVSEPWPDVIYYGYVKNENSNFKLVLLNVNGQLVRLKENEEIAGLLIEEVKKDSLILSRGHEFKKVKKNQ